MDHDATLKLSDGTQWRGTGYGHRSNAKHKDLFVNSLSFDLEKVLTRPCNSGNIAVNEFSIVGFSGIDNVSHSLGHNVSGLVVGQMCDSVFKNRMTLDNFLLARGVACISGIDVASLLEHLRSFKTKLSASIEFDQKVSMQVARPLLGSLPNYNLGDQPGKVALIDLGLDEETKQILLNRVGFSVFGDYDYNLVVSSSPKVLIFSDGGGSPLNQKAAINLVKANLLSKSPIPMLGIGLGHLVLALGHGLKLHKLPCGYYGDIAVRNVASEKLLVVRGGLNWEVVPKSLTVDTKLEYQIVQGNKVAGLYYKKTKSRSIIVGGDLLIEWLADNKKLID